MASGFFSWPSFSKEFDCQMLLLLNELEIANSKMKTSELVALSAHVWRDLSIRPLEGFCSMNKLNSDDHSLQDEKMSSPVKRCS